MGTSDYRISIYYISVLLDTKLLYEWLDESLTFIKNMVINDELDNAPLLL
ncbi:hypothetical protein QF042_003257 [Pedobacter sp. W3I1]|nr:hypothetical protein [Pedobacter sp. W3I1]